MNSEQQEGLVKAFKIHYGDKDMFLKDLQENNRREELLAVFRFIDQANVEEITVVMQEILCCHSNLFAWNADTKLLAGIESICQNGDAIQLNIEGSP